MRYFMMIAALAAQATLGACTGAHHDAYSKTPRPEAERAAMEAALRGDFDTGETEVETVDPEEAYAAGRRGVGYPCERRDEACERAYDLGSEAWALDQEAALYRTREERMRDALALSDANTPPDHIADYRATLKDAEENLKRIAREIAALEADV